MGLEDAAALAALLPLGSPSNSEEIPKRLELFEKIRKPRAEWLAELSAKRAYQSKKNDPNHYSRNETYDQIYGYDVVKVIKDAWNAGSEKMLNA
jgi:2-polyprenyl-6-methoxyphenol hydroxylase-like FAD-dependent oxidoreductase